VSPGDEAEILAAPGLAGGIDADPGGLGRLVALPWGEVVPEQEEVGVRGRMKDPLAVEAPPLDIDARREERILEGSLPSRGEPKGEEDRGHEVGGEPARGQVCQDSCDPSEGIRSGRPILGLGEATRELEAGEGGLVTGSLRGQAVKHFLQKGDRRLPLRSGPVDPAWAQRTRTWSSGSENRRPSALILVSTSAKRSWSPISV
jgi:hypothetical protein